MKPLGSYVFFSRAFSGSGRYLGARQRLDPTAFQRRPSDRFWSRYRRTICAGSTCKNEILNWATARTCGANGNTVAGGTTIFTVFASRVPESLWVLFAVAIVSRLRTTLTRTAFLDEMTLSLPALFILGMISSQSGFNHHFRYALPALPFLFVWVSQIGRTGSWTRHALVFSCLTYFVSASALIYPHSVSYFNAVAGGPSKGANHLLDSNLGWGQDLLFLRKWILDSPQASPLGLAYVGNVHPNVAGIHFALAPFGPRSPEVSVPFPEKDAGAMARLVCDRCEPGEGRLSCRSKGTGGWITFTPAACDFSYFDYFEPVATAGYSIWIYRIDLDEANRVRSLLHLDRITEQLLTQPDTQ